MATKVILPKLTEELDKIQLGWLNFGHLKVTTFDALEKDELAVQLILTDYKDITDLPDAQEKLKQAKALATESEGRRLYLTNMIRDKIIVPAMVFEKRTATLIEAAEKHELSLRKVASAKEEEENVKGREVRSMVAHFENEYFRIAAKYRQDLEVMVLESYKNALKNKTPVKEIKAYCKAIEGFLKEVKVDKLVKFDRVHLSKELAGELFKGVPAYDPAEDLASAIGSIKETFTMYAEDLKNRSKAMKKADEEIGDVISETEKEVTIQTSMTELASQAEPLVLTGGGNTKIKKKLAIVEENTAEWAVEVITQYMTNLNTAKHHIRVSLWSKLTVGQMGAALAKVRMENPKAKFGKLKFKEEEK
jgi:hypothetical protein